ncbi:hypothetical protein NDU88_000423 [Pleurodeles waltl]|uniref:Uncharacterized protein n=1 Tax=Pleurodeles waltl TaxID=8319 RepID=A0AAV7S8K5_PLEWA|nr:hypothetical protein NDU88_000423 [Pleurodeles waltl]
MERIHPQYTPSVAGDGIVLKQCAVSLKRGLGAWLVSFQLTEALFGVCRGVGLISSNRADLSLDWGLTGSQDGSFSLSPTGSSMPAGLNCETRFRPRGLPQQRAAALPRGGGRGRGTSTATALTSVQVGVAHPRRQCGVLCRVPQPC